MDKSIIEKRFFNSFSSYDENAFVQNKMAENIVDMIKCFHPFNRIFEIGCGTGTLTKKIIGRINFNLLIANDIADCRKYVCIDDRILFIKGDIESIEIPLNNDLVISNATFQWLSDYNSLFNKIYNSLNRGGILAFTTFGNKNFIELREIGLPSLKYYNITEIAYFYENYFEEIYVVEDEIKIEFDSFKKLFYHIKATGVNALKYDEESFAIFAKYYKSGKKAALTYNPLYFVLRKKL